ncbi:MAG: pirin family protein [Eubacteriales bacterium]
MSKILNSYKPKQVMEGAGVLVNRMFSHGETEEFDPFLMLDYFNYEEEVELPGFPWHPHRGIETITYFLVGSGEHEDSIGNQGIIHADELQWMSSGSGIYHQEMPIASKEGLKGFQFWLNMHAKYKMQKPDYQYIMRGEMQSVKKDGTEVRIISGQYEGIRGPINKEGLGVTMLHVLVDGGKTITLKRGERRQGFIFVFEGSGKADGEKVEKVTAYTLAEGELEIKADKGTKLEFIFAEGIPLKEPIAWNGPIVMNTHEELVQAFKDLQEGTFIK